MSFDWPNLIAGGAIGFVVGFAANEAYARHHLRRAAAQLRQKYSHITGSYVSYPFVDSTDLVDHANPVGRCRLEHLSDNVLLLHHEEDRNPNIWEAVVWMETPFCGSMAWRYVKLGASSRHPSIASVSNAVLYPRPRTPPAR